MARHGVVPLSPSAPRGRRVGIRFLNTSNKEIRLYWLRPRRGCETNDQEARDYQVRPGIRIKPWEMIPYQVLTGHQFVIQYGMDSETWDSEARAAFICPEVMTGLARGVTYKYIRIPHNIPSGSAFDMTRGVTIDPDTWTGRVESRPKMHNGVYQGNGVEDTHYVGRDNQSFIDISNRWRLWQKTLKEDDEIRQFCGPADKMRWGEMGSSHLDPSLSWWCTRCNMPNSLFRTGCWVCATEKVCESSEETTSDNGDVAG